MHRWADSQNSFLNFTFSSSPYQAPLTRNQAELKCSSYSSLVNLILRLSQNAPATALQITVFQYNTTYYCTQYSTVYSLITTHYSLLTTQLSQHVPTPSSATYLSLSTLPVPSLFGY
ncbi:hypothetical protein O181_120566 [Austropuccinia psidii MF-1]|uniref:Uncharacterized protein n=1 Tax=Austropuccinia psidii MF-1 TaxID=1389203 RepID=A0A9Q3Q0P1_9BASI|nr:hypothetical protein [Austropuccinia psidii MF-1]